MELYIHGENALTTKLIEVSEPFTLEEVIVLYKRHFGKTDVEEEVFIFLEDEDEPWDRTGSHGFRHKHHIHAHRCHKIEVKVIYNGETKEHKYSPAITGEKLLTRIAHLFGITPIDATNLILTYNNGKELEKTTHLGSIVPHGVCRIDLSLVPDPQIKG